MGLGLWDWGFGVWGGLNVGVCCCVVAVLAGGATWSKAYKDLGCSLLGTSLII